MSEPDIVYIPWNHMHPCNCERVMAEHVRAHVKRVKARVCDTCNKPFVPKHWEDRYKTCQKCWYGGGNGDGP